METNQIDERFEQLMREGGGEMISASMLSQPLCIVCGKEQGGFYIALKVEGLGASAACLHCANERFGEQKWIHPNDPRVNSHNIQIGPYRSVPTPIGQNPDPNAVFIPSRF